MAQSILPSTLLALNIFLSPITPQIPQVDYTIPLENPIREVIYVVKKDDTLAAIAEDQYGSSEYWPNILKDNDWIKNPNILEEGQELKISTTPPLLIAKYESPSPVQLEEEIVLGASFEVEETDVPQLAAQAKYVGGPLSDEQITFLGTCESGMTATRNSGNGYYGAFQFSIGTWNSMGTGYIRADLAPLEVQRDAVQRLLSRSSIWTQFPGCASKMRGVGLI